MPFDEFGNEIPENIVPPRRPRPRVPDGLFVQPPPLRRFDQFIPYERPLRATTSEYSPTPKRSPDRLLAEISQGTFDDRTLSSSLKAYGVSTISHMLNKRGVTIAKCSQCTELKYSRNLRSVYSGRYTLCSVCGAPYVHCAECNSLILSTDTQLHFHSPDLRRLESQNTVQRHDANVFEILGREFRQTSDDRRARFRDQMFIGVELEIERGVGVVPPDMILKATRSLGGGNFAIAQHDGSLQAAPGSGSRGSNGFEIVTLPATKRYHLREAGWQRFFEILSPFSQAKPPTAGLHFHVSTKYMTRATIGKLVQFINDPDNIRFLILVADRDFTAPSPATGRIYAQTFPDIHSRVADVISRRTHVPRCPMAPYARSLRKHYLTEQGTVAMDYYGHPKITAIDRAAAMKTCNCPDGHYDYRDHYAALNLKTQHPTVEFRIFQGSMNPVHFFASMDFCHALIAFCEDSSFNSLSHRDFLEWFRGNRPHHPHLAKWLVQCGVIEPKGKK